MENSGFNFEKTTVSTNVFPENLSSSLSFSETFAISTALFLILLGSIAGNLVVMLAIRKDTTLHTPANYLICSLAFTDLMVAFLVMPISAVYQILGEWIFGDILCQIWTAMDIACCTASILHLCAIALERHQLITNAVRYFAGSKKNAVAPKIVVVWVLAICISLPPVLGWRNSSDSAQNVEDVYQNQTLPKSCEAGHEPGYEIYATLGSFYIPLLLLLFLYVRIYRNIHSYVKRSESRAVLSSVHSEEAGSTSKRKSSLLSFLRKSYSKGSVKSRKNSHSVNISPPPNGRFSNPEQRPNAENDSQLIREEVLPRPQNANGFHQPNDNQISTFKPKEISLKHDTNSPNESLSKNNNCHPSASCPSFSKAHYKRTTFMRRQMAIDDSIPENSSNQDIQLHHSSNYSKSINKRENLEKLLKSTTTPKRRYSEGDAQLSLHHEGKNAKKVLLRSRAHTAGAKVHFKVETRSNEITEIPKPNENPIQEAEPARRSSTIQRNQQKSRFTRSELGRRQTITSGRLPKRYRYFSCCLFTAQQNYTFVNQQHSLPEEASPFVRYSYSTRSKIKALKAREIRAIRTLGTIVGAFVVCWLPFFIVTIVKPFCSCFIPKEVEAVVLWLGYCNSLVNPIIYTACNREFHAAFKKLLHPRCQMSTFCKCEDGINYV